MEHNKEEELINLTETVEKELMGNKNLQEKLSVENHEGYEQNDILDSSPIKQLKTVSFNNESSILCFNKDQSINDLLNEESFIMQELPDTATGNQNGRNTSSNVDLMNMKSNSKKSQKDKILHHNHNSFEKQHSLLKNLVIQLEKLPDDVSQNYGCRNSVRNKSVISCEENKYAVKHSNSYLNKLQSKYLPENTDISQSTSVENLEYNESSIKTTTTDLSSKGHVLFPELQISLQQLPADLLEKEQKSSNFQNSKTIPHSASLNSGQGEHSVQSSFQNKHIPTVDRLKTTKNSKCSKQTLKGNKINLKRQSKISKHKKFKSIPASSKNMAKTVNTTLPIDLNSCDKTAEDSCVQLKMLDSNEKSLTTGNILESLLLNKESCKNSDIENNLNSQPVVHLSRLPINIREITNDKNVIETSNELQNNSFQERSLNDHHSRLKSSTNNSYGVLFKNPIVVLERLNITVPETTDDEQSSIVGDTNYNRVHPSQKVIDNSTISLNGTAGKSKKKISAKKQNHVKQKKKGMAPCFSTKSSNQNVKPKSCLMPKNNSNELKSSELFLIDDSDTSEDLPLMCFANSKCVNSNKIASVPKRNKIKKPHPKEIILVPFVPKDSFSEKKQSTPKLKKTVANQSKSNIPSCSKIAASYLENIRKDHTYFVPLRLNAKENSAQSTLTKVRMDHSYNLSCSQPNAISSNQVFSKISKRKSNKKRKCANCKALDDPAVFLKTYLDKFCSDFDKLGGKKKSLSTAPLSKHKKKTYIDGKKRQEQAYGTIISKLQNHLEDSCAKKETYKTQNVFMTDSESNVNRETSPQLQNIPVESSDDFAGTSTSFSSESVIEIDHSLSENGACDVSLPKSISDNKILNNRQSIKTKKPVEKYRLGFLTANNPLRLYNKCLVTERLLLSKYKMKKNQRKKLKKMFNALKNNAANIEDE